MTKQTEYILQQATLKTLPEFSLLQKGYSKDEWLIIGTLTHAKKISAATQLLHFKKLMHALGKPNNTFGHRLHWLARVGGGEGTNAHTHLHFLLSKHQLTNGHRFSYTPDEVVEFIETYWTDKYGMKEHQDIALFDSSRNGISYVLRDESREQERIVEMSQALHAHLKKSQQSSQIAPERDPLVEEVVNKMRARGGRVGFGDQMNELRAGVMP